MKISIIGYSGSGKTTLAELIGRSYNIPVLFLDRVQFSENWQERDRSEALSLTKSFMEENSDWVIEGNYTAFFQKERLMQSDRILFLDFTRTACFVRVLKRFWKYRGTVRDNMPSGCEEKMDAEFIRWVLWDQRTRKLRQHFKQILRQYPEKTIVIKNQRQLDRLKANLP